MEIRTVADLEDLIAGEVEEGLHLEYKGALGQNRALANEAAAFANTRGGQIVVGVTEKDRVAREITWVEGRGTEERVRSVVGDLVTPLIEDIDVTRIGNPENPDLAAYVIGVPVTHGDPHMVDGRFYKREGSRTLPMNHAEVVQAFVKRGRRDAIRQELVRSRALLQRTAELIDRLFEIALEDRHELALVPFDSSAWNALISSGLLFAFGEPTVTRLLAFYSVVHEFNSLVPVSLNGDPGTIIHTPADPGSMRSGTYYPRVIEHLVVELRRTIMPLVDEFDLEPFK